MWQKMLQVGSGSSGGGGGVEPTSTGLVTISANDGNVGGTIPVHTSASSQYAYWNVFSDNSLNFSTNQFREGIIYYKFSIPKTVKYASIKNESDNFAKKFYIEGSNDNGTTWEKLSFDFINACSSNETTYAYVNSDKAGKYSMYAIHVVSSYGGSGLSIRRLQFYGY